ncbi:hypothetical protein SUGI_0575740 [Cryptomeria japonica]|nr:hypothetical protein SUGI_0575740 [Cryptomeria japonica]
MATSNFAQLIGVFCMLCAKNTLSIPIIMAHSAGVNFSFNEFTRCNTSDILCVNDATISGHKIHLTNKTMGRVVYSHTIQLSSIASFTTDIRFVMKYYNRRPDDQGGDGIAFFMTSKEIATIFHSVDEYSGLPGNGSISDNTLAVEFSGYNRRANSRVYFFVGSNHPIQTYNYTHLNFSLNDGKLWNAHIDCNVRKNYMQIFLFNTSNSSMSQRDPILAFPFDCFKFLPDNFVVGISAADSYYSSETHTILSWSFNTTTKIKRSSTKMIFLTTVGFFLCLTGAVVIYSLFANRKKKRAMGSSNAQTCEDKEIEISMLVDQGPSRYKLEDLKAVTNNFSETLKLGQGEFGGVYKGVIGEANDVVAVKRISQGSRQGLKEFISEISIVSRVKHRNLVQLLGWCHEKGELLLVYEYICPMEA